MSNNKLKDNKQQDKAKNIKKPPTIILSKEDRVKNLVNFTNDAMYLSLQAGDIKINDP